MSKPPSKSVFVGNIPYGLTEEQITDIFSSAGKVLSFRLVYDRETGRPKGFGFAEYPDSDSAASAVRNLNDFDIMNRKLRVDFSNDGAEEEAAPQGSYSNVPAPLNGHTIPPPIILPTQSGSSLPPLPLGIDLPANLTCPDAISRTLNTLRPAQLLDVLSQMKNLVTTDQAKATELLRQAPQLSYAIFQALLLMGLVSTEALTSVVEQATTSTPAPQQQYAPPPPPQMQIPAAGSQFPPGFPPPPQHMVGQMGYPSPLPPQQQYRQQVPVPPSASQGSDTDALVQQVLTMPQEVIDSLPPAERAQLLTLKAGFLRDMGRA